MTGLTNITNKFDYVLVRLPNLTGLLNLAGTVSRDFLPLFFCLKDSIWSPYEQAETVWRNFYYFVNIFAKKVCLRSRWLRGHANFELNNWWFREIEKVRVTVLACSYGAQIECFKGQCREIYFAFLKFLSMGGCNTVGHNKGLSSDKISLQ